MNAKGFLGTILFGVAAGIAIGVLMAPDKGAKTRKKMTGLALDFEHDLKDNLKHKLKAQTEKFDDLAETIESEIDNFKCKVDKLSEKLQSKMV